MPGDAPRSEVARAAADALVELVPRLARMTAGALAEDPPIEITLRQFRILERLLERPHRTTELAASSGIAQPTASTAIATLVSRRLVEKATDPTDGRATLVTITAEGRQVWGTARSRILERLEEIAHDVDEEAVASLQRLVPLLTAGMDRARARIRGELEHGSPPPK